MSARLSPWISASRTPQAYNVSKIALSRMPWTVDSSGASINLATSRWPKKSGSDLATLTLKLWPEGTGVERNSPSWTKNR